MKRIKLYMNKAKRNYRNARIEIAVWSGITFNILAIALIVILLLGSDREGVKSVLAYTIPLISPLILFFAFRQSRMSNNIQNSLEFFKEELKNVDRLIEVGEINHTELVRNFNNKYCINDIAAVQYKNISGYFKSVAITINNSSDFVAQLFNKCQDEHREMERVKQCKYFTDFLNFRNGYYNFLFLMRREIDNVNNLYNNGSLVKAHRNLLYRKLYPVIEDFFKYYQEYCLENHPNLLIPYYDQDNKEVRDDRLFLYDFVEQKNNEFKFLMDYGYNLI